jgi:hypothetical protein
MSDPTITWPKNALRVRVTATVYVDPDAWALEYGVEGQQSIRQDVQTYFAGVLHDSYPAGAGIVEVVTR